MTPPNTIQRLYQRKNSSVPYFLVFFFNLDSYLYFDLVNREGYIFIMQLLHMHILFPLHKKKKKMFIFEGKLLLLLTSFIFISLINTTTTFAQPDFLYSFCQNAENYTANSTYQKNLNTALSTLPTTNNGFGFYNFSTSQGNDTVYSVSLCRGDINLDVCQSCLNDSIVKLRQVCPNQKEAFAYYDYCMLKYSNQIILGTTGTRFYTRGNPRNITDIDGFNGALAPLLRKLRVEAAAGGPLKKFASDNTSGPGFSTIYGLVQCTPDLSEQQCSNCLESIINRIVEYLDGKQGGRILLPGCNFRYEIYRFVNQSARVSPPPPVSQPIPPPSSPIQPPGMIYICLYHLNLKEEYNLY
ncbi:putative Gnk2-like domain-containing protein [Helianthus annuus]|nr:putative Gnk2-like domain-containing protein [Helianthus annuus]